MTGALQGLPVGSAVSVGPLSAIMLLAADRAKTTTPSAQRSQIAYACRQRRSSLSRNVARVPPAGRASMPIVHPCSTRGRIQRHMLACFGRVTLHQRRTIFPQCFVLSGVLAFAARALCSLFVARESLLRPGNARRRATGLRGCRRPASGGTRRPALDCCRRLCRGTDPTRIESVRTRTPHCATARPSS